MSRQTHRPTTAVALALSLFMAALEMTVVSTAMPTVVGELGGIEHYAWVFTAYLSRGHSYRPNLREVG